ncbi:DMT family transporter [Tianweitania sp.]|uniref:DMT family transporter n=1 Tax=Tianweitania sp. TaxID=2021634 RepID=UPI00289B57FC|nr:DMT family transporter [Tianweitania sp.]
MTDRAFSAAPSVSLDERLGVLLIFLSALFWSFGGTIVRFVEAPDSWTIVLWRSLWATLFLLGFMIWRDGVRGTLQLFRAMGLPGIVVGLCFAVASSCFVIAVGYTTIANVVLINAGVPLFAALIGWMLYRDRVSVPTWIAIGAVILGVGVMVSDGLGGDVSLIGNAIALVNAIAFAIATVVTRRHADVRMTPATCLGAAFAGTFAATQASTYATSLPDFALLVAFGALNLGLGLALFASGARLVPAALAALIGTLETVLGPIWVWLVHAEIPSERTLIGGAIVFAALLTHIGLQFRRPQRPAKPGVSGVQTPN